MPKPCVVPQWLQNCLQKRKNETLRLSCVEGSGLSCFRVSERLKKWHAAIPGNVNLRGSHVVCDKHFEERYIYREWIKYNPTDMSRIITRGFMIRKTKTRPALKRINRKASAAAINQRKLSALLKKTAHEWRNKMKAQGRLHILTKTMQDLKEKIARIEHVTLQKKCSELNIPDVQKLALKEIIEAAGKNDARRRRYTDEWIMLCMLMNIRSNGFYEFLRKNDVLSLPCSRTMSNYFTRIDFKCGFDQQFAKLLMKRFVTNKKCS